VDGNLLLILIFAGLAAFVFFRLFSVLGQKTGNEPTQPPMVPAPGRDDQNGDDNKVVNLPRRDDAPDAVPAWGSDGPVGAGMTQISLADRSFDRDTFLAGSRAAFEMIIEAFHKGELEKVRPFLADDVYRSFAAAVAEREKPAPEHTHSELIAVNGCEALSAGMEGRKAVITVRFESEQTEVVKDSEDRIVAGDLTKPLDVVDVWTFARDTRARDPNWQLVATRSPD